MVDSGQSLLVLDAYQGLFKVNTITGQRSKRHEKIRYGQNTNSVSLVNVSGEEFQI